MLNTKEVIVGNDIYTIECNGEMPISDALGCIYPPASQIRLRLVSPLNIIVPKRQVYRTLMHEIIHAIDRQTYSTSKVKEVIQCEHEDIVFDDTEIAIDLLANYVIDNLIDFIDNRVEIEEFTMYCQTLELKLVRLGLFFDLLMKTINQNQDLMIEFLDVFTE